jgi:large conductance mechanosensitive channel
MLKEFKAFAMRGNVLDLAVGVIIGAAFGKIISSFVADIMMPPIGMITGGVDFSFLKLTLKEAADKIPAVTLNYGLFFNHVIDFLIVAFAIFLLIRMVNRWNKPAPAEVPTAQPCPHCLMEIPIGAKRCGHCTQAV